MNIILAVFLKIFLFGTIGNFGSENIALSYFINGLSSNFNFWNVDMHE